MRKRLLIALVGLGFVCVLAMWFVSHAGSTTDSGVTRTTDASHSTEAADMLAKPSSESEIRRAAVVSPAAPASVDSTPAPIPPKSALVKVLVVDKVTQAPLQDMEVYSTTDAPIFGDRALNNVHRARGQLFEILVTDANGRVEIETPANVKSNIAASGLDQHTSYANSEVPPLAPDTTYELTLELNSGFDMPFWIKVVDAETKGPLSGVKVTAEQGLPDLAPATSDVRGLARIEARSYQQTGMSLDVEGHAKLQVWTESGHEREENALIVPLPRSATLRVHAVWAGGNPVVNADVELTAKGYELRAIAQFGAWGSSDDPRWRGNTDASGRLTLADLPPHVSIDVDVSGQCKWKPAEPIVLEIGEVRDVEWTITNGCVVTGSLTDQHGRPVTDQKIWLRKAEMHVAMLFDAYSSHTTLECTTDDSGRFRIADVSAGSWSIGPAARSSEVESPPDGVPPFTQLVEIAEGQRSVEVSLRVDRGLFIRGQVIDSAGQPSTSVHVFAIEAALRLYTSTNRNLGDGAFSIGPLMDGDYDVNANGLGQDAKSETIKVRPGAADVVLHLKRGACISGRVVGEEGNGVAGEVHIANRFSPEAGAVMLSVTNDGTFWLSGLEAGTYDLSAMTSSGWIGYIDPVAIAAGETAKDLLIRVSPGGRVRVRHEGPEKYALINVVQNGVQVSGTYVAIDKPDEWPSPLGSVVVRVQYYDEVLSKFVRTAERAVEVTAGEVAEVEFEKGAQ